MKSALQLSLVVATVLLVDVDDISAFFDVEPVAVPRAPDGVPTPGPLVWSEDLTAVFAACILKCERTFVPLPCPERGSDRLADDKFFHFGLAEVFLVSAEEGVGRGRQEGGGDDANEQCALCEHVLSPIDGD